MFSQTYKLKLCPPINQPVSKSNSVPEVESTTTTATTTLENFICKTDDDKSEKFSRSFVRSRKPMASST